MDALEYFGIILDLSRTEQLYDYVEQKIYKRPESGEWDMSIFKGKGTLDCVHEDDEEGQLRVDKLDKCFADKRILEKKSKLDKDKGDDKEDKRSSKYEELGDDSIFSFENNDTQIDKLPRRIIPFHKAGDVVKGNVVLTLNKPLEAEKLVVGIQGRAFIKIRIYYGKGAFDAIKEEMFVKEKVPVWERSKETKDASDEFSLLSTNASISRSKVLSEGTHTFPFEFTIPVEVAQSTVPLVESYCNRGDIMYRIKATIDNGNSLARGNIVTHKGLWVKRTVDIAQDPHYLDPIQVEETLSTRAIGFWKSGRIIVRATLLKSAFLVGDPLPVTIEITNESKGDINWVSAYIRCIGKAKLKEKKKMAVSVGIDLKSEKVKEGAIPVGSNPVYKWLLPWDFNCSSVDGLLMPVGTVDDCQYIEVRYEVCIKLKRKGLHRDMELNIPITVGNVDSKAALT